jgi:hypothetical protein
MSIVTGGYEFSPWMGWANRFALVGDGSFRTLDAAEARALAGAETAPAASMGA